MYKKAGDHDGWPHCTNASGVHLYRRNDDWFLNKEFTPDKDTAVGKVPWRDGLVPTGSQDTWNKVVGGTFVATTFTVTEMVWFSLQNVFVLFCFSVFLSFVFRFSLV